MKKLVAPEVTSGDWKIESKRFIVSSDAPMRWTVAEVFKSVPVHEANARFLAGSKRLAEAAAKYLMVSSEKPSDARELISLVQETKTLRDELRAALLASGYQETE